MGHFHKRFDLAKRTDKKETKGGDSRRARKRVRRKAVDGEACGRRRRVREAITNTISPMRLRQKYDVTALIRHVIGPIRNGASARSR